MIQDLYFIFGYSQIWLNLPKEMIATFSTSSNRWSSLSLQQEFLKKAQLVYCIRNIEVTLIVHLYLVCSPNVG
jgi:hypothetical protein